MASLERSWNGSIWVVSNKVRAARRAQEAGYLVRVRIDPIVPTADWKEAYAETVERFLAEVSPERMTLGTLRFEEGFYRMRDALFTTGRALRDMVENMEPMFDGFAKPAHPPLGTV